MDLNQIQQGIEKLKQYKEISREVLAVENEMTRKLMYSATTRKKYNDVLAAIDDTARSLAAREKQLMVNLNASEKVLDNVNRKIKDLKKSQSDLLNTLSGMRKAGKKGTKEYKDQQRQLIDIRKALDDVKGSYGGYSNSMNKIIKESKTLTSISRQLHQNLSDIEATGMININSYKDLHDLTDKRIQLMERQLDLKHRSGTLTRQEMLDMKKQLHTEEKRAEITSDILKGKIAAKDQPMLEELTRMAPRMGGIQGAGATKYFDLASQRVGAMKGLLGKGSLRDRLAAAQSLKDTGEKFKSLRNVMKATGKDTAGLSGMFRMLGEAMKALGKLGWIGLIIQAVMTVASIVNRLDKFLKSYNKAFMKMHGPTIMMEDVGKSMKVFTDSIFDLKRNLELGLKSEEILGMFQGISEAGMNLQGVIKSVEGGYKKAIDTAAKIHLDFGVSLEESGSMMGEQLLDLRSSIDDVSDSFKAMAYDASIAGIQSQKFYQATYAAAEALSYYGNFLESASTTLRNFQEQGAMGFKDAQKATQEATNLFKTMDQNTRIAFINMTGGISEYAKDAQRGLNQTNKSIEKHNKILEARKIELKKAEALGETKRIEELQNLVSADEKQMDTLKRSAVQYASAMDAIRKGAIEDFATYLPLLADQTMNKVGRYFDQLRKESGGIDIFGGNERAIIEQLKVTSGMSEDLIQQFITTAKMNRRNIDEMSLSMEKSIKGITKGEREGIGKILKGYADAGEVDITKLRSDLENYAKSKDIILDMDTIIKNFQKFPNAVSTLMGKGYEKAITMSEDLALKDLQPIKVTLGEDAREQNKRLSDIVKNTHTIEEMIGINKEFVEYAAASSDPQRTIAGAALSVAQSTGGIFEFLKNRFGKKEDLALQKINAKNLEDMVYEQKMLKAKLEETSDKGERAKIARELLKVSDIIDVRTKGDMTKVAAVEYAATKRAQETIKAREEAALDPTKKFKDVFLKTSGMTFGEAPTKTVPTKKKSIPLRRDYQATTGGYALLSRGDVVVNAKNMSSGIGGDIGAFSNKISKGMIGAMTTASQNMAPNIPVNITIGSIEGNPEEFLRRIRPAIEQSFERMYFDKQRRK